MPMINIAGTDVEFSSFRETPVDDGIDEQRGVNGDLNATILYVKREFSGTVPCFDRTSLDALITLADYPNTVNFYGDLPGISSGSPIGVKVRIATRDFNIAGLPSGFYAFADVTIKEA